MQILAVAVGALGKINLAAARVLVQLRPLDQPQDPGHLVRVHVQQTAGGIEGRATPFSGAIKTREYDRTFQTWWDKLARATNLVKLIEHGLVCLGCPLREHLLSQDLARERRRLEGKGLLGRGLLAVHFSLWNVTILDGEQRLAVVALENKDHAGLGDLSDGIHQLAVSHHGYQVRGRGKVAIPEIVLHGLKMPDALAGRGLQSDQRVGEQIVAQTVGSVEIEGRRAGRHEDQAALFIHAHARPVVRRAAVFPGVLGPGFIPEFAGMRNGVKAPANFSGADVERADVAGRTREILAHEAADDEQVAIDDAWGCGRNRNLTRIAPKSLAEIDAAGIPETGDGCAGLGIERIQIMPRDEENALILTVFPVRNAAVAYGMRGLSAVVRIEGPSKLAGCGIECDDAQLGRGGVQNAVDHDRIALHLRGVELVTGVEGPGDAEILHVAAIDLVQIGIANAFRAAAVDFPITVAGGGSMAPVCFSGVHGETGKNDQEQDAECQPSNISRGSTRIKERRLCSNDRSL